MNFEGYGQIVNVANSVRKYYGLEQYHKSNETVDKWLNNNQFRCIITLLVDAMGVSILKEHLRENDFLRKYISEEITTVFPPTTTAATTSFRNGKYPIENAWLGWNQYFKDVEDNLILFFSKSQYQDMDYPGYVGKYIPVNTTVNDLKNEGIKATEVWPRWGSVNSNDTFEEMMNSILNLSKTNQFIYAYWDEFDTYMHKNGTKCSGTKVLMSSINLNIETMAHNLPKDVGLMIVADHSQIEIEQYEIPEVEKLIHCLKCKPELEPRTIGFHVKEEKETEFLELYHQYFENDYQLYSHEEVFQRNIFGKGEPNSKAEEFIGNYVAVAKTNRTFKYGSKVVKGDHAGGTIEEALIPLILFTNKQ